MGSERCMRPMRGLKTDCGATVVTTGHTFIQNIHRGHCEPGHRAASNSTGRGCLQRAGSGDLTDKDQTVPLDSICIMQTVIIISYRSAIFMACYLRHVDN
jgi:hypothetical protein